MLQNERFRGSGWGEEFGAYGDTRLLLLNERNLTGRIGEHVWPPQMLLT
jgi:hypothetical protein